MVPLMERIAWQLCERVDHVIDVNTLFKYVWIHWRLVLEIWILRQIQSESLIKLGVLRF